MNSPPKKRPMTHSRRGGGVPHFVPQQTPQHNNQDPSSFAVTPRPTPTTIITNTSLSHRFDAIQFELNQQRDCNARFDTRISNLEITLKSIDSKIDRILDQMDASFQNHHKIPRTSSSSYNDAPSHPGQASMLHNNLGNKYNDA